MSLASTQADVDSAMVSVLSSIASAQATYYASKGYYFASPWSHTIHPADGNSVAADNLSEKLAGYNESWTDFGVNPGTIPCAVKINAYKSGSGHGYTVSTDFTWSGGIYTQSSDVSGGASGAAVAWQATADPLPPDTYSSTSEAFCTSGSDVSGVGTATWLNPTNIYASDSTYASYDATGGSATTHYLLAKGFGFAIPSTAVIDGIEVTTYRGATDNATHARADDSTIKLFYSGSAVGTNQSTGSHWADGGGLKTFGGATSAWGYGQYLTPTVVNASTFGVGISSAIEDVEAYVDYVKMKVYYTVDATRAVPTITSLDVSSGTTSGGTTVVITGTGFKNGISGTLGGNALTFTSLSSTSLTFSTPAHAAGATDLVLTNVDGKSVTSSSAYTYTAPAPSFFQYATDTGTSSGGITPTFATPATAGSLIIAILKSNSGVAWTATSGSWTQLNSGTTGSQCFYKVAAGGETALSFDDSGATKSDIQSGMIIEVKNVNAIPIDANAASTGTATTPSVTTTQANDLVLSLAVGGSGSFTAVPSGWTSIGSVGSSQFVTAAYKTFASAGATGTAAWTSGGGESKVFTVAVKG